MLLKGSDSKSSSRFPSQECDLTYLHSWRTWESVLTLFLFLHLKNTRRFLSFLLVPPRSPLLLTVFPLELSCNLLWLPSRFFLCLQWSEVWLWCVWVWISLTHPLWIHATSWMCRFMSPAKSGEFSSLSLGWTEFSHGPLIPAPWGTLSFSVIWSSINLGAAVKRF